MGVLHRRSRRVRAGNVSRATAYRINQLGSALFALLAAAEGHPPMAILGVVGWWFYWRLAREEQTT